MLYGTLRKMGDIWLKNRPRQFVEIGYDEHLTGVEMNTDGLFPGDFVSVGLDGSLVAVTSGADLPIVAMVDSIVDDSHARVRGFAKVTYERVGEPQSLLPARYTAKDEQRTSKEGR